MHFNDGSGLIFLPIKQHSNDYVKVFIIKMKVEAREKLVDSMTSE